MVSAGEVNIACQDACKKSCAYFFIDGITAMTRKHHIIIPSTFMVST
jgi:hypothetical protein